MPGWTAMPPAADPPPGERLALVVATSTYTDPGLRRLRAPARDAADLAQVLADPDIGDFTVITVIDQPAQQVRLAVEDFLDGRGTGDLLLVYLSCHGLLDARRRLYFAAADTRKDRLGATGVESAWVMDQLEHCRARRQVLILDSCFSGAFAHGAKGQDDLDLRDRLIGQGRGRVVLTASTATEYSFEGNPTGAASPVGSVFTAALVRGLRTGAADIDRDGYVSVDDAYAYVFNQVQAAGAAQTPQRWLYGAEGRIVLAFNPAGSVIISGMLPESLRAGLDSPHPGIRIGAVTELGAWLTSGDPGRAATARRHLQEVANTDIPRVARTARTALGDELDEERRLEAGERRLAEAEFRTEAVNTMVAALERLLQDRHRHLAARSRRAEDAFNNQGSEAFVDEIQRALATSVYPDSLRGSCAAMFRPEARELLVEYELPRQDVIPAVKGYRYVKTKDLIQPEPRTEAEIKKLYEKLIARVALRTLAEAFDAAPATLISGIIFNGYVSAKDRTTGKPIRPLLISVHATRDDFVDIVLDEPELDPVACLRGYLNAVISPHPFDLEPVRSVVQFDLSKYKFVEEMDVIAGLDSHPDLLALTPMEFEHLIRQLFEAIGMKSWVTQASKDEGVDGVAVNADPIVGGLYIFQAKRYTKMMGLEAVQALAGVVEDKNAAKGILVTTSWAGKASLDFAARNGRIEIIDGRQLKSMLRVHLGLDVRISLPKLPPDWEQDDVS